MSAPRAFLYVQHLLGIGHLARASRIARALKADGFEVAVVTGGMPVPGFPGPDLRHITLPAIQSSDVGFSGLADAAGQPVDDAFKSARRDLLLAAYRDFAPDVVITEAFPFGRRQVRFELLPLLEEIHGQARRPRVVASIRDILQARAKPGRDAESLALIEAFYDAVLVHGDPGFVRLEETFPLADRIAGRIRYTGLVVPEPVAPAAERVDITVSAGGGAVGRALIGAAAEAARLLDPGLRWRLVTGPNLPQTD
ncbi:glycosyl transferase, partial [Thioclava sp. BHET1]